MEKIMHFVWGGKKKHGNVVGMDRATTISSFDFIASNVCRIKKRKSSLFLIIQYLQLNYSREDEIVG